MRVLGIETSCDETAAAVVVNGTTILANQIASQIEIHARYGGVVPEVASRQHILAIVPVVRQALDQADVGWGDLDAIAVTVGPGLAGSLLVGASLAKALALAHNRPLIGVNHLEGHIYANWLGHSDDPPRFPLLCLIVSGGHSDLVLMRGHGEYILLGRTRDDAAGEAFDKAARILGLGYPGGPVIAQAARKGRGTAEVLPRAWLKDTHDFSFSGVKTALVHRLQRGELEHPEDIAAAFQEAVVDVLVTKTIAAAQEHGVKQVLLAGGVAANQLLRDRLTEKSPFPVRIPAPVLCTDNAAMVASCGYFRFQRGLVSQLTVDIFPALKLGEEPG